MGQDMANAADRLGGRVRADCWLIVVRVDIVDLLFVDLLQLDPEAIGLIWWAESG